MTAHRLAFVLSLVGACGGTGASPAATSTPSFKNSSIAFITVMPA